MEQIKREKPEPTAENLAMAWDIHKDADALLHNRLNAFLVVQALMFGAYFVAVDLNAAASVRVYYQTVIFLTGCAVSIGYWRLSQRMIHGILLLKNEVLLPHIPIYNLYYRGLEKHRGTPANMYASPSYNLHQWSPWIFFALWCLLIFMAWATAFGWSYLA